MAGDVPEDLWFIAIGASGSEGLLNIKALLQKLGPAPDAVIMVVLHRPFDRPSHLREVLQTSTPMRVIVAKEGEKLEPGAIYIGDPDAHLTLLLHERGGIRQDQLRSHRNRTVDLLFKSIAAHAGPRGIGVILSGALDDGARGVQAIHAAGGRTMVLLRCPDHPGMPENAIRYDGPIDVIGSTAKIAVHILDAIAAPVQTVLPNC